MVISTVGGAVVPGFHAGEGGPEPSVVPGGEAGVAAVCGGFVDDHGAGPGPPEAGEFFDDSGVG